MDLASIVVAVDHWRQAAITGGGWAGAWAGAEGGGASGAALGFWLGSEVPVIGNAIGASLGGIGGRLVGGVGGYFAGAKAAEYAFDNGPKLLDRAAAQIEELTGYVDVPALLSLP